MQLRSGKMRLWRSVVFLSLPLSIGLLLLACAHSDSTEFEQVSARVMGCTLLAPWPVKMTSSTPTVSTFVRTDDTWSLPLYFRRVESPSWTESTGMRAGAVEVLEDGYFTIVQYREIRIADIIEASGNSELERLVTVIRRTPYELVLIGELGSYWAPIVNSCEEMEVGADPKPN